MPSRNNPKSRLLVGGRSIDPQWRWALRGCDFLVAGGLGAEPFNLAYKGIYRSNATMRSSPFGPAIDTGDATRGFTKNFIDGVPNRPLEITLCAVFYLTTTSAFSFLSGNRFITGSEDGYALYAQGLTCEFWHFTGGSAICATAASTLASGNWYAAICSSGPGVTAQLLLRKITPNAAGSLVTATGTHQALTLDTSRWGAIGNDDFPAERLIGFIPLAGMWHWRWPMGRMLEWLYDPFQMVSGRREPVPRWKGVGGTLFTQTISAGITPAATLARQTNTAKAGALTPAATLTRVTARALAAAETPSGALTKLTTKGALTGALTPAGTLSKRTNKTFTGGLTPAGTLARAVAVVKAATITPAGALLRAITRTVTGTVTPAGALTKRTNRALAAGVTPTATLTRAALYARTFAAGLTPAAVLSRLTSRPLAASVTPGGTLSRTAGKILTGSITPSATLTRLIAHIMSAGITPAGTLARTITLARTLSGSITPAATLTRRTARTLTGTVTPAGAVLRSSARTVTGTVTPTVTLTRTTARALAAAMTPAGALTRATTHVKTLAATMSPSAVLSRLIARSLAASMTPTGTLTRSETRTLTASVTPAGTLSKRTNRTLSGTLTPAGALLRSLARTLTASMTPGGTLTKRTNRSLSATVTPTATLTSGIAYVRSIAATMTPTAVLTRITNRALAASVSSTATLSRLIARALVAILAPTATLSRSTARTVSATVAPTGTLSRTTARTVNGIITPTGLLTRVAARSLSAIITPAGTLTRMTTKVMRAEIFPLNVTLVDDPITRADSTTAPGGAWVTDAGVVGVNANALYAPNGTGGDIAYIDAHQRIDYVRARLYSADYLHAQPRIAVRYIDPNNYLYVWIDPATQKARVSAVDSGVESSIAGALAPIVTDGDTALVEAFFTYPRTLIVWVNGIFGIGIFMGAVEAAKYFVETKIAGAFANVSSPLVADTRPWIDDVQALQRNNATLVKQTARALVATVAPAGVLSSGLAFTRTINGTIVPAGSLVRSAGKSLNATVAPTATVTRRTARTWLASLIPAGALRRSTARTLSGTVAPTGALSTIRALSVTIAATLGVTGTLTRVFTAGARARNRLLALFRSIR